MGFIIAFNLRLMVWKLVCKKKKEKKTNERKMKHNDSFTDMMHWWVMNWAEKLRAGKESTCCLCCCTHRLEPHWFEDNESRLLRERSWMHGWMDGLREWRKRGWEARGWAEKLISDSPWVSHYYGYCVIRFRICKALTVHSPAAASTFLVKVRLSLNYSLSLSPCLSTSTCSPWERESEEENDGQDEKREKGYEWKKL